MNNRDDVFFEGLKNPIEYRKVFSTLWDCQYDLSWYPFDTQI